MRQPCFVRACSNNNACSSLNIDMLKQTPLVQGHTGRRGLVATSAPLLSDLHVCTMNQTVTQTETLRCSRLARKSVDLTMGLFCSLQRCCLGLDLETQDLPESSTEHHNLIYIYIIDSNWKGQGRHSYIYCYILPAAIESVSSDA